MRHFLVLAAALCSSSAILAQTPPAQPPSQTPPPAAAPAAGQAPPAGQDPAAAQPEEAAPERDPVYVRRVSFGATLSVTPLTFIPEANETINTSNPVTQSVYRTESKTHHAGYGGTVQLAVSERFAVAASLLLRRVNYKQFIDIHTGVDNPNTLQDDRAYRASQEETRARMMDIPLLVRYYGKDRHDEGHRWFAEGGGVLRRIYNIGSSRQTTVGTETTCCDTTPVSPANSQVRGAVVGFGGQFIDPLGIRVVPEVRYTRWFAEPFNQFTTRTKRHQVEIIFSLTF